MGLFKKSPSAIFFGETNLKSPQHHDEIKKKPMRKESFQETILTTGEIQVSFINKNHFW